MSFWGRSIRTSAHADGVRYVVGRASIFAADEFAPPYDQVSPVFAAPATVLGRYGGFRTNARIRAMRVTEKDKSPRRAMAKAAQ